MNVRYCFHHTPLTISASLASAAFRLAHISLNSSRTMIDAFIKFVSAAELTRQGIYVDKIAPLREEIFFGSPINSRYIGIALLPARPG